MKAGTELDALVAEKVMGLTLIHDWPCGYMPDCGNYEAAQPNFNDNGYLEPYTPHPADLDSSLYGQRGPVSRRYTLGDKRPLGVEPVPFYSTDMAAAWTVVEKLKDLNTDVGVLDFDLIYSRHEGWGEHTDEAVLKGHVDIVPESIRWFCQFGNGKAEADTAPLAICLAALKAVKKEST